VFPGTINPGLLGFDFDGVIADTAENFIRLACEEYGLCGISRKDITNFEVEQCLDMPKETAHAIFTSVQRDSIGTGLKPMPGAVEVIGELTEKHPVTVITARSLSTPVHDWLAHIFPPSTLPRIKIIAMGAHDKKSHHIHKQHLKYFIDDRAETCVQLSKCDGIDPIVFAQPWNENRHQLPVVRSWQDIKSLCL
jgi:5'(3')-deoxyribonucleotidase